MPDLVEKGHLFIAQPPLYKVKRGKQERYIKDEAGLEDCLIEMGTEHIRVRTASSGNGLVGQPLQAFVKKALRFENMMATTVRKRRSRSVIEGLLMAENFGAATLKDEKALRRLASDLASYVDLVAPDEAPFVGSLEEDPEHDCYKLVGATRSNGSGLQTIIDRELLTSPEYRELKRLFSELTNPGFPPYTVESDNHKLRLRSLKELLDYILEMGKKGQDIQRYKGLGEMNPEQLWETTMNPESRVLLQVRIEDAVEANDIFSTLMGDAVEPRRKFIEDHALAVKNLDI
jgi:DNA gyrase subunit B